MDNAVWLRSRRKSGRAIIWKAPDLLPFLGLLIDRSGIAVTASGTPSEVARWTRIAGHPGDAQIVADAARAKADALVILDRKHLHGNRALIKAAPFHVFTPADFLARFRDNRMTTDY